jgi:uncharacterized protein (DUF58 family)
VNNRFQEVVNSVFSIGLFRFLLIAAAVFLLRFDLWSPAIITVILLVIAETGRWWSRSGLRYLELEKHFKPQRLFAGEKTSLTVNIYNHKFLPLIAEWTQELPDGLDASDLSVATLLPRHSSFFIQSEITARRRGFYEIPPSAVTSSDGTGLFSYQMAIGDICPLIVYPRLEDWSQIGLKPSDLIGEMADRRYILPDPVKVAGLREYTPDMPARLINWKASAGKDMPMAKMIEPSADYKFCLAVDADIIGEEDAGSNRFEKALSIAASITVWADENGIAVGLVINASQTGLPGPVSVPVNTGFPHTLLILEKLARVEGNPSGALEELLWKDKHSIPWGTALVVIGASIKPRGMGRIISIPC